MVIQTKPGDPIRLNLQLFDGDSGKFVQAIVADSSGTPLAGSPVTLSNSGNGLYEDDSLIMPTDPEVTAIYKVYNDAGFTTPSAVHADALDIYRRDTDLEKICEVQDTVNAILAGGNLSDLEGSLIDDGELVGIIEDCGS